MTETKSLAELMGDAVALSWELIYEDIAPDGTYLTPRQNFESIGTDTEKDMISSWADGLYHKYYDNRTTGHCSLQAMIDFDVEKFEKQVEQDIETMKRILAVVPSPVKLDFAEMQRRGYRGEWAGL